MCDPSGSDASGAEKAHVKPPNASPIQIAPLIRLARAKGFDFLAYLLAMALKESRRLSGE
jgi:hypothetical protein